MTLHVDVWSDFVCPWCFLVSTSLKKLQQSHGVTVTWKSYELRPKGSPPMPESYREHIRSVYPQMVAMAESRYGVEINGGPVGIDSRPAHIGFKYAESLGKGDEYHQKVFSAYWQHAENIEDRAVLARIATECGINRESFLNELEVSDYEKFVDEDIEIARQYQLRGVPALIFENKYYIPGAQPYEELADFVEQLEQQIGTQS